jgi:hypothetical protein
VAPVQESPNEARKRWQHEVSPKSFHSSIIGSARNHSNVTAYDLAIGGGQASSHPKFYAYLCAVADWRMQQKITDRPSIMKWTDFESDFRVYWTKEPPWRKELIEGNASYYSVGKLPKCLPAVPAGLPASVVSETTCGIRAERSAAPDTRPAMNTAGTTHTVKK